MPASRFMEWMEYERLEPFGAPRDNWHAAMIATILANVFRDPKKPVLRMSEFFYKDSQTAQDESDQEMLEALRAKSKNG